MLHRGLKQIIANTVSGPVGQDEQRIDLASGDCSEREPAELFTGYVTPSHELPGLELVCNPLARDTECAELFVVHVVVNY